MWYGRIDPGPCPVCDAPHTTCTSPDYRGITVRQAPARDAALAAEQARTAAAAASSAPAPAGTFTTATYRGRKRVPR